MKNTLLFTFLILIFLNCSAQDISGQWSGILKVPGMQLGLVLHITKTNGGYSATLDSPNQGAKGIPVNSVEFSNAVLKLTMTGLNAEYTGTLGADTIFKGIFKQNGQSYPLDLGRGDLDTPKLSRPQEPVKPYPYYSEDVKFENSKDKIALAGTLTLPAKEGKFPVVVLISGSGPQDRNEELLGHKPFLVLSDYLTKNGIAVLRYDDRGTAESTGIFSTATTTDFATDVEAAVEYLKTRKEINQNKIGLIGHSEGGIIAPMVAAGSADIAFIVLLAGPGIPGDELLIKQSHLIFRTTGVSESILDEIDVLNKKGYSILKEKSDFSEIKKELLPILDDAIKLLPVPQQPPADKRNEYLQKTVNQLATPWFQFLVRYNPAEILEKVKCPVLALNGSNDLQVPAKDDLEGIRIALEKGGNENFKIKELPKLNHLFQESETGSPSEYAKIEQTFSPTALTEISEWIKKIVLNN